MNKIIKKSIAPILFILAGVACYYSGVAFLNGGHNSFLLGLHALLTAGLAYYFPKLICGDKCDIFNLNLYALEMVIGIVVAGAGGFSDLAPVREIRTHDLISLDIYILVIVSIVMMTVSGFLSDD